MLVEANMNPSRMGGRNAPLESVQAERKTRRPSLQYRSGTRGVKLLVTMYASLFLLVRAIRIAGIIHQRHGEWIRGVARRPDVGDPGNRQRRKQCGEPLFIECVYVTPGR